MKAGNFSVTFISPNFVKLENHDYKGQCPDTSAPAKNKNWLQCTIYCVELKPDLEHYFQILKDFFFYGGGSSRSFFSKTIEFAGESSKRPHISDTLCELFYVLKKSFIFYQYTKSHKR